ncbi:glycosyltransferase family 2 protein [Rhodobium gokarnense]|nr:glycosyltransferase family 2 protein [Rhodobium gokarnense]
MTTEAAGKDATTGWAVGGRLIVLDGTERHGARFRAAGPEAALRIDFEPPRRGGWCTIEIDMWCDSFAKPRALPDFGDGIDDAKAIPFKRLPTGVYRAFVRLPGKLHGLVLRPAQVPMTFEIADIRIEKVGIFGLLGVAWRHAKFNWNKGPRAFVKFLGEVVGIVALPKRFSAFRDAEAGSGGKDDRQLRYEAWCEKRDFDTARDGATLQARVDALAEKPVISVIMPVCDPEVAWLDAAVQSVVDQAYSGWELCVADDASTKPDVIAALKRWRDADPRIKVAFRKERGHISNASNSALELSSGTYLTCLDHDDTLAPHALAEAVLAFAEDETRRIVYSDEDKIDEAGTRFEPHFKPDWSPDLFHSVNYLNHLTVYRRDDVVAAGGWRVGVEGSQDYDLLCRVIETLPEGSVQHLPLVLYHWRAIEGSTALATGEKNYAVIAGLKVLKEHAERAGIDADVEPLPDYPFYRFRYRLPENPPLVSIIIPTRNGLEHVRRCIGSIRERTDYPNYEIILIDNQSDDPEALSYFAELDRSADVRVLPHPHPFNFSAINNRGVAEARGEVIALLNNDIEILNEDWLSEMVGHALRPEIGCVGAKLHYPDGRIQHGGVIIGIGGMAGHAHLYQPGERAGYYGRLVVAQNLSAVTGAAMVMRKEIFQGVGGFEEEHLGVALNDIDLCLKIRKAGYRIVWTPFARMIHYESVSRGLDKDDPEKRARHEREKAYMRSAWGETLNRDPYYSPHLELQSADFLPLA